jgi:hypothetical protein
MKLMLRFVLPLAALVLPVSALAQGSSPSLTIAPIRTVVVVRGSKAPLQIDLRVNRGFHVNSNHPNDELLIPTTLHLNPPDGIVITNVQYPKGEDVALAAMNEKLNVYSGDFTISGEVRIPKSAALGTLRVHGTVKYQACDNRQCFPPKTTPLEFDVKVVRPVVKKGPTYTPSSPHIH